MAEAFLKWAGGKRWFIKKETHRLPAKDSFYRYVEPFLGGGSVFFYLEPHNAVLSDCNEELIKTYTALRDNFEGVYKHLLKHQSNNSKEYYYAVRAQLPNGPMAAAARMIYLNRACFNGIYRVNRKGHFNVPYGSGAPVSFNKEQLKRASLALQGAELIAQSYLVSIDETVEGDFLFCDPPYAVQTAESFVGYNATTFTWSDQIKLAESVARAAERGVKVMVTNVDVPEVRALYDPDLFSIDTASRKCLIAGGNDGRQIYYEMIATSNI